MDVSSNRSFFQPKRGKRHRTVGKDETGRKGSTTHGAVASLRRDVRGHRRRGKDSAMHEVCKAWVYGWKHALRGRTLDLPPTPHVDAKKTVMRSKRHEVSMDVNGVV